MQIWSLVQRIWPFRIIGVYGGRWRSWCATAVRRILAELADSPGVTRAADLATKAATSAPAEGRAMYAGLRTLPLPGEPVARLWHSANLLREHRGDGHVAALVSEGIGGLESHALYAVTRVPVPPSRRSEMRNSPPAARRNGRRPGSPTRRRSGAPAPTQSW
jgi:hypothetical protein